MSPRTLWGGLGILTPWDHLFPSSPRIRLPVEIVSLGVATQLGGNGVQDIGLCFGIG
jgi:hypothetical protein